MANELKKFAKAWQKYVLKDIKAASVTAINRAIASTKTLAVREVADATGGTQKDLKVRIGQFKATAARPSGAMISFAKPISLSAFSPKEKLVRTKNGKGQRTGATIKGPEGRYLVAGAFLLNTRSRVEGKSGSVFAREGKQRLPIKKLYTNALIKYMSQPDVMKKLEAKATTEFEKNLVHEMKRRQLKATE